MPFAQEHKRTYRDRDDAHAARMAISERLRITDTNLARLDVISANLTEQRAAMLEEKLRVILSAVTMEYPDDVIDRLVREEHFPETFATLSCRQQIIPEDACSPEEIARTLTDASWEERIVLCRGIAHAGDRMYHITPGQLDDHWVRMMNDLVREEDHHDSSTPDLEVRAPKPAGERIAYLRNAYTDTAFETFSAVLRSAQPTYYSDFPGVCEALYYDHATACILPLENSSDGKLLRFYSLMAKYDLRIAYVTSVAAYDNDVTTRYALLRRNLSVPRPETTDALGMYLELRITADEALPLYRILAAADAYHLSLQRVDSVPGPNEDDDRIAYDLILRVEDDGDPAAMLTYCYLLSPGYTLLGIYLDL